MPLLADGINLPLVAVWGLVIYGPLTLLVTAIESFVLRVWLTVSFRGVFRPLLLANIVSTLAGLVLLGAQDLIVYNAGVMDSIPAFVRGYRWVALLLIAIYWSKSVVVEFLVVLSRKLHRRLECSRSSLFRGLLVGNVVSYLVVGPLFYMTTRPSFGGLETTFTTQWTANADQTAYYVDSDNGFIKRIQLDGRGSGTVVPFRAQAFLMSADSGTFAYRGVDGNLYAYRVGHSAPLLMPGTHERCPMTAVSLSPDRRQVVYAEHHEQAEQPSGYYILRTLDLDTAKLDFVPEFWVISWSPPIVSWSADGTAIYAQQNAETIAALSADPPYPLLRTMTDSAPLLEDLVENYACAWGRCGYLGSDWLTTESGEYRLQVYPYLGAFLWLERDGEPVLLVRNQYGLLNMGLPGLEAPSFLPNGVEILVEWREQLYVIDAAHRRLGLLSDGQNYVLRTPRFRVHFRSDHSF